MIINSASDVKADFRFNTNVKRQQSELTDTSTDEMTDTPIETLDLDEIHGEVFGKPRKILAIQKDMEDYVDDKNTRIFKSPIRNPIKKLFASQSETDPNVQAARDFMEQRRKKNECK